MIILLFAILLNIGNLYANAVSGYAGGLLSIREVIDAENFYENTIKQLEESEKQVEDARQAGNAVLNEYKQAVEYIATHVGPNGQFAEYSPIVDELISRLDKLVVVLNAALGNVDPFIAKLHEEKSKAVSYAHSILPNSAHHYSNLPTEAARNVLNHIKKLLEALKTSYLNSTELKKLSGRIEANVKNSILNTNAVLNILLGYKVTFTLIIDSEGILSEAESVKTKIQLYSKSCHTISSDVFVVREKAKGLFEELENIGLSEEHAELAREIIGKIDLYSGESKKIITEMNAKSQAMDSSIEFIKKDVSKLFAILHKHKSSPHVAYKMMEEVHLEIKDIDSSIAVAFKWVKASIHSNFSILTVVRELLQLLGSLPTTPKETQQSIQNIEHELDLKYDSQSGFGGDVSGGYNLSHELRGGHGLSYELGGGLGGGLSGKLGGFGKFGIKNRGKFNLDVGLDHDEDGCESGSEDCKGGKCCKNRNKKKSWFEKLGLKSVFAGIKDAIGFLNQGNGSYSYDHSYNNQPNTNLNGQIVVQSPDDYITEPGASGTYEDMTIGSPKETYVTPDESADTHPGESSVATTEEASGNESKSIRGGGEVAIRYNSNLSPQSPSNSNLIKYNGNISLDVNLSQSLFKDPLMKELMVKGEEFMQVFDRLKAGIMNKPFNVKGKIVTMVLIRLFRDELPNICYNFNQNQYYYHNQPNSK